MMDNDKFKAIMGNNQMLGDSADTIDQRIEENIQKRELTKLRSAFHENLKQHYR